jgi:hypothetical protein
MTLPLIDKQDGFEIVRDKIAQILADETVNQQALATGAGKDPALWKFRVYLERANAWEQYLDVPVADQSPIVNVWYSNDTFPENAGNVIKRQKAEGIFNIDCYGYAEAADDGATGHLPGDRETALVSHRALKLVRNILMAAENIYLGIGNRDGGPVWGRWPQSRETFHPELNGRAIQNIVGSRLSLRVEYNETSPQVDESTLLEQVFVDIKRASDGQVIAEADYDYTP